MKRTDSRKCQSRTGETNSETETVNEVSLTDTWSRERLSKSLLPFQKIFLKTDTVSQNLQKRRSRWEIEWGTLYKKTHETSLTLEWSPGRFTEVFLYLSSVYVILEGRWRNVLSCPVLGSEENTDTIKKVQYFPKKFFSYVNKLSNILLETFQKNLYERKLHDYVKS